MATISLYSWCREHAVAQAIRTAMSRASALALALRPHLQDVLVADTTPPRKLHPETRRRGHVAVASTSPRAGSATERSTVRFEEAEVASKDALALALRLVEPSNRCAECTVANKTFARVSHASRCEHCSNGGADCHGFVSHARMERQLDSRLSLPSRKQGTHFCCVRMSQASLM